MSSTLLLGLIGNPDNRRIAFAQAAAADAGISSQVFAWQDYPRWLDDLAACDLLKLDSAGEHALVNQQQIVLGGGPETVGEAAIGHGELAWLSEAHRGFCQQLDVLNSNGLNFINSPAAIKIMFDKWASHKLFDAADVARPVSFPAPDNVDDFLGMIQLQSSGRLFLKPLHGSSASGVLAFRWQGDKLQIIAPVEIDRKWPERVKFFNSLRIRSYLKMDDIKAILQHFLPHGMIAEQWLRKAQINNRNTDVRVVVIAGKARHLIGRKSQHPMTNLHLGSERVSEKQYTEAFGHSVVRACRDIAEQAAACFPDALYSGVDVMLTRDLKPVVLEINAFGDLLPNVTYNDLSTYSAITQAAIQKYACSAV